MADDTDTLGGQYTGLWWIEETEPNMTPDAAAWDKKVHPLKDFSPTFNPNWQPIPGSGSKRLYGYAGGGPYDVGFSIGTQARGDLWLEYLKLAFGKATGTGDPCNDGDKLPTFSLLAHVCRKLNGTPPSKLQRGFLYNGCKLSNFTLKKENTPTPLALTLAGRCQYGSKNTGVDSGLPTFSGFQGTVGVPLTIASLGADPDPDLKSVQYFNFDEKLKYDGESEVDITRIENWELGVTQALTPIPGRVIGADTNRYPVWKGFGEDMMEAMLKIVVMPSNFQFLDDVVYDQKDIEYLKLEYTAPSGYSVGSKTIELQDGKWEIGDWNARELATMRQEIRAKFKSVVIS